MNFLAHFYFDQQKDLNYNLGLVFPDLYRNFVNKKLIFENENHSNFWQGCHKHVERDKIFHNSKFFNTLTNFISNNLDHKVTYERKWFLNHILLEIALDRFLMDKNPELCKDFYENLIKIEIAEIIEKISKLNTFDIFLFENKFNHFVKNQYIFSYQDNNKISYALQRIFERASINSTPILQSESIMNEFIPKLLEKIEKEIKNIE